MTKKEKSIQQGTYLPNVWKERCKLWNKSEKLRDDDKKMESYKLYIKSQKLFTDAVREVYGKNVKAVWNVYGCTLSNGMEFNNY